MATRADGLIGEETEGNERESGSGAPLALDGEGLKAGRQRSAGKRAAGMRL
jgi:hypothetical protein